MIRATLLLAIAPVLLAIEPGEFDQLLCVKRIYVDKFDGDPTALQMRDMIIVALQQTHLFVITENQTRADAFLRGSSEDLVFSETHFSSDGVNAHLQASDGARGINPGAITNRSAAAWERMSRATASSGSMKPRPPSGW